MAGGVRYPRNRVSGSRGPGRRPTEPLLLFGRSLQHHAAAKRGPFVAAGRYLTKATPRATLTPIRTFPRRSAAPFP